jgi:hypothetical protein
MNWCATKRTTENADDRDFTAGRDCNPERRRYYPQMAQIFADKEKKSR